MESICKDCGAEIDDEVCWCGEEIVAHGPGSGHVPRPIGCSCGMYAEGGDRVVGGGDRVADSGDRVVGQEDQQE